MVVVIGDVISYLFDMVRTKKYVVVLSLKRQREYIPEI